METEASQLSDAIRRYGPEQSVLERDPDSLTIVPQKVTGLEPWFPDPCVVTGQIVAADGAVFRQM